MPTRLRRRVRRAVEPLDFALVFRLAAGTDRPSWLELNGRRIAPAEQLRLYHAHAAEVLAAWAWLVEGAQRRLAATTGAPRAPEQVEHDELWASGLALPWVAREALGRRVPRTRRGVAALLERHGLVLPEARR